MRATLLLLSHPLILLLARYCYPNISEALVMHEAVDPVALRESRQQTIAVFGNSSFQMVCHTRIEVM